MAWTVDGPIEGGIYYTPSTISAAAFVFETRSKSVETVAGKRIAKL